MKATFALLADQATHNAVRTLAWHLHCTYRTGLRASRLPPHISLKQPFAIADIPALECYFDTFAARLSPFAVTLPTIRIISTPTSPEVTGIVWFDVEETPLLRQLHNQLNHDLAHAFGDTHAPFDGDSYHFHMTVAISNQPTEAYHQMQANFGGADLKRSYTVQEIAMFVYDETIPGGMDYMTYKILSLGG